ncbi:Required for respiratory growth protein 9 mitochondrial [Arthrobotrys musiformis]|uniref:Required for respiratory growth protein 9, mitochondrial n=1 Tax=Arthrobotrys musiformis TaxID=47236 RepID=A0AAV9WAE9_9PEZI
MTTTNTRLLRLLSETTTTLKPRRLRLPPTIRHTSSSTPRHQSAELNINTDTPSTDFLNMYSTAKKSVDKAALATWGTSWKPETDLSAMRDSERLIVKEEEYVDDFQSLPKKITLSPRQNRWRREEEEEELNRLPPSLKSQFPTRASNPAEQEEVPWDNPSKISKKLETPHDPTANAWKEWSTPALWSHARMQELYKPRTLTNGIRITKHAALSTNNGQLNWNPTLSPDLSLDKYKSAAGVPINHQKKIYDKDTPQWKIHQDAVRSKLKSERWNPFSRLSPAAVATLKQLKAENPGMTVEEYAPIFKISPDALRRILKSKWTPKPEEEADRNDRWRRRGKNVWQEWEEKGLVQKKRVKAEEVEELGEKREREKREKGFVVSRGLNLKNRIL